MREERAGRTDERTELYLQVAITANEEVVWLQISVDHSN